MRKHDRGEEEQRERGRWRWRLKIKQVSWAAVSCSEPSEVTAYEPEALVRKCVWVGWMWFYHHGRKDLIIHK
jgi:hypothetical protein